MLIKSELISFSVFAILLVVEHAEIGGVAAGGYVVVLNSLENGAAGLMGVRAIREPASAGKLENVLEIATNLLRLHVEGAKAFDARCIDGPPAHRQGQHFAERCGMSACVVSLTDFGGAQLYSWNEPVEQRGFSHSAIAAEKCYTVAQQLVKLADAIALLGRNSHTLVANVLVEGAHHLLIAQLVGTEQVGFVEHQHHGDAVGLGGGQKAVDEGGGGFGIVDGDDEKRLVNVGGQNVALLGEVRRLSDDVVAAVANVGDVRYLVLADFHLHPVAYGNGIGAADALEPEVALDFAVNSGLSVLSKDGVVTASIFNDKSFQRS